MDLDEKDIIRLFEKYKVSLQFGEGSVGISWTDSTGVARYEERGSQTTFDDIMTYAAAEVLYVEDRVEEAPNF